MNGKFYIFIVGCVLSLMGQAYEGMLKYKDAYRCYQRCLSVDTLNIDVLNAVARTTASYFVTKEWLCI